MEKLKFSKAESVPRAGHAAWITLILLYSVFLSIIGWGIVHLVLPSL